MDPYQLQELQRDRHPLGAPGHLRQQGAHLYAEGELSSHALLGRGTLLLGFAQRLLQAIGYVFGGCACAVVQRPWH